MNVVIGCQGGLILRVTKPQLSIVIPSTDKNLAVVLECKRGVTGGLSRGDAFPHHLGRGRSASTEQTVLAPHPQAPLRIQCLAMVPSTRPAELCRHAFDLVKLGSVVRVAQAQPTILVVSCRPH